MCFTRLLAGEKMLAIVYGGKAQSLDQLRYKRYRVEVFKRILIHVDYHRQVHLSHHCLRVFHQVQEWLGNNLDPLVYGWENDNGKLSPKATDVAIAPDYALKKLKCGFKRNCKKSCSCIE